MTTVQSTCNSDNSMITIAISGKFNFSLLSEFRQSYSEDGIKNMRVILDLRQTTTIDSSALGMLLNMKRSLGKKDSEITIINANEDVRKILLIACFNHKFTIE